LIINNQSLILNSPVLQQLLIDEAVPNFRMLVTIADLKIMGRSHKANTTKYS